MPHHRSSTLRAIVVVACSAACLAALPASASAGRYCVNDPDCAEAGGITSANIAAAVAAANGVAGADTIYVGASSTPYELAGTVTIPAGDGIDIRGAGAASTVIDAAPGQMAFDVLEDEAILTGLTIRANVASLPTVRFQASNDYVQSANLTECRIVNTNATAGSAGVSFATDGSMQRSTVELPLEGDPTRQAVTFADGATVNVRDSTLTAPRGVRIPNSGRLNLYRSTTNYTRYGVTGTTSDGLMRVDLTSDVFRQVPDTASGSFSVAVDVTAIGGAGTGATVTGRISNSTFVHPGANDGDTDYVLWPLASGGTGPAPAATTFDLDGVIMHGAWDSNVRSHVGSGTSSSSVTLDTSNYDPALLTTIGGGTITQGVGNTNVDPRFVDLAGGDVHLRWDSPLLDAGRTAIDGSWEADLFNAPNGSTWDRDRDQRLVVKTADLAGTPKLDLGAYEYNRSAPSIASASSSGYVAPGAALSYTVTGADRNAGEAAELTYAWSLPGGASASGPTVSFDAPAMPGTYTATVTVTDPSGLTATGSVSLVVPPVAAPPVPPPPVLTDVLAPKVVLTPTAAKLSKLLKRTPVKATFRPNEAAAGTFVLEANVVRRVGKVVRTTRVVLGTAKVGLGAGSRVVTITPTKVGVAKLVAARRLGPHALAWAVTGTATDAAGNASTFRSTLKVTA